MAKAQQLLVALLLAPAAVQSFISPAIWSRINSHLRLYGSQQEQPRAHPFLPATRGRRSLSQLLATASFGGFGGANNEDFSFAEMRDQLQVLESELAGAMELGRYEEAKQLVNEITTLKDFIDQQLNGGGGSAPVAASSSSSSSGPRRANPFFDAFGLSQGPAAATMMAPAPSAPAPQARRRPGFGAFGGVVGSAPRRRPASKGDKGGLLSRPEGWAGKAGNKAGDMPMEAVRKRHSDITAYGIRVEVFCFFQPAASRPQDNLYQFQCNIRITNTNPGDVQLLSRELKIFKADGSPPEYGPASQQLESQPVVGPGSVYMYMSEFAITCVPEDKKYLGRIEGHFNVAVKDENAVVKVPIAPFWLEIPGDTLVLA